MLLYKVATIPVIRFFERLDVNCSRNMAKPYCGPRSAIVYSVRTIDPVASACFELPCLLSIFSVPGDHDDFVRDLKRSFFSEARHAGTNFDRGRSEIIII